MGLVTKARPTTACKWDASLFFTSGGKGGFNVAADKSPPGLRRDSCRCPRTPPFHVSESDTFRRGLVNLHVSLSVLHSILYKFPPSQQDVKKGPYRSVTVRRTYGEISVKISSQQEREELNRRAREGETVIPGGSGGKSLEAQEHLAEGRSCGGQTRREQLGTEGYQEMGRKGGLSTTEESGGERAAREGVNIDESKYRTG